MIHRFPPKLASRLAPLLLAMAAAVPARAAVQFSDNYSSYTAGSPPPASTSGSGFNYGVATNDSNDATLVNADAGNLFGAGTANQFLQISDLNTTGTELLSTRSVFNTTTGLLAFDFIMPTAASVSPASSAYSTASGDSLVLRLGGGTSNGFTAFALAFRGSTATKGILSSVVAGDVNVTPSATMLSTLNLGSTYHIDIVFNNSASTFTYAGGTVASAKMDVYVNGTLVGSGLGATGGANEPVGTALTAFNFTSKGATTVDTLYIDNVSVNTVAAVPEPGTAAALGAGALLLAAGRMRRRKR